MGFSTYNGDTSVIADLDDRPNDTGGLDAAALKAKFDEAVTSLAAWINSADETNAGGLIGQLEAGTAAGILGFASDASEAVGQGQTTLFNAAIFEDVTTVKGALIALAKAIYQIGEQIVADDSLETVKYKNGSVTADKLAENAVTPAKLAAGAALANLSDGSVSAEKLAGDIGTSKLASGAVSAAILAANAVETAKIKDGAVTLAKLASNAVEAAKIKDGAVTSAKLASGAAAANLGSKSVAKSKLADDARVSSTVVSIGSISAGGTKTVSVSGVTASNIVLVSPQPDYWETWRNCGVRCKEQASGSLTFTAESATGGTIKANVVILP